MYHIILNPVAGKKKAQKNLAIAENFFKERGIAYEAHQTCAVHDAEDIVRRLTLAGETEFIVIGGDGTLHEVLNGIVDPTCCALGLIPLGTGNDFAATANLPYNAAKAIDIILNGEVKDTDYLEVGDKRCMNVGGMGIDVDVLVRCSKGKQAGKIKYLRNLVVSLFKYKGSEVTVECEGETVAMKALVAFACNGKKFGGGIPICPVANLGDDKMDVIVVECLKSRWDVIRALVILLRGKIMDYPYKRYFKTDKVKIIPKNPAIVNLDGELYENLAFDVKVCHGLKMYRP
jgi:YegS/Rv2252/BmrU family lipid kinase